MTHGVASVKLGGGVPSTVWVLGEALGFWTVGGIVLLPGPPPQLSLLVFPIGLSELLAGVHDEGAVASDGLPDGGAA